MPIALATGPANAGKARLVLETVRAELARGREPWLIVPTRADVEHYRRELAADRVILGVRVEGFEALLDEIVRRAGTGGEVLGAAARECVLRTIADERAPDGPSRGYARALGELISELRERRVAPAQLTEAVQRWERAEHAYGAALVAAPNATAARARTHARGGADESHLSAVRHARRAAAEFEQYDALLRRIGRVDREQRATAGLDRLRRSPWLWGTNPVLLYGFDDLTRLQLDAIETLGRSADATVTVSLAYERGRVAFASRAGAYHALEPLARECTELDGRADHYATPSRASLAHLERSLFEEDGVPQSAGEAVRLIEGADEREELELVAEEIAELLDAGAPPEDVAVVLRSPDLAGDLLEEVFSSAGIPVAFERARRFADTATGASLIGALRSAGGKGNARGAGDAGGAGDARDGEADDLLAWLRTPGLLERPELADRLELRARRAGARTADDARALWEAEHWPLDALTRLAEADSPRALLARALEALERAFTASRARAARVLEGDELDEARALAAGRRALEELAQLARLEPRLAPGGAHELAQSLHALRIHGGDGAREGRVAVLSPLALRARRVRALFLCGLQAGIFPVAERQPPVLGEEARRRLAEHSALRIADRRDALGDERYLFYAAVSRPEVALVLSWHRASEKGEPRVRSPFVDDVCELFDADLRDRCVRRVRAPHRAEQSSVRGATRRSEAPARRAGEGAAGRPRVAAATVSGEQLLGDAGTHVWSASSLALWMSCPVRWFVERVLRAEELEPQREPLARGIVAHAALKDTLEALARETGSALLTPPSLPLAREHLADALARRSEETPLSPSPPRAAALRRRLAADLERYLAHAAASAVGGGSDADGASDPDDDGAAGALEPTYLELEFGLGEASHPALDLGDGVRLRGRIDRVDVNDDGAAVVVDYKASRGTPAAKWLDENAVQVPLYMRAVETLLGLDPVGGFYQPLSGDLRARGVLAREGGVALATVGSDLRDRDGVRELVEACVAAVREAAGEAARGELEPRPQTCSPRGGCSYPGICRCER